MSNTAIDKIKERVNKLIADHNATEIIEALLLVIEEQQEALQWTIDSSKILLSNEMQDQSYFTLCQEYKQQGTKAYFCLSSTQTKLEAIAGEK